VPQPYPLPRRQAKLHEQQDRQLQHRRQQQRSCQRELAPVAATKGHVDLADATGAADELREGVITHIEDCVCHVGGPLGMGSFGAVWAAKVSGGPDIAIKEILCDSHCDLSNALYEGQLLSALRQAGEPGELDCDSNASSDDEDFQFLQSSCLSRVPALVAVDTSMPYPKVWRVRLAMTRIPGETLENYIVRYGNMQAERYETSCPSMSRLHRDVIDAAYVARELLAQLAPTFEHISRFALHRDVNGHNILIDRSKDGHPMYGLVDFGLAVNEHCWRMDGRDTLSAEKMSRIGRDGSSTWHTLDVGGDCRYWPVSAWVQFLSGAKDLLAHPPLCLEYLTRLDFHALGITALELFVEMLPRRWIVEDRPSNDKDGSGHQAASWFGKLAKLQIGWQTYWKFVADLHRDLMAIFHNGGDWNQLKLRCIERDICGDIQAKLLDLRAILEELDEACRNDAALADVRVLCAAWRIMVNVGCSGGGADSAGGPSAQGPRNWRSVSRALSKSKGTKEPKVFGACGADVGTSFASTASTQVGMTSLSAVMGDQSGLSLDPKSAAS